LLKFFALSQFGRKAHIILAKPEAALGNDIEETKASRIRKKKNDKRKAMVRNVKGK
jgi:hypothetical protein